MTGKAVMATPAIAVASRDAQPDRTDPGRFIVRSVRDDARSQSLEVAVPPK